MAISKPVFQHPFEFINAVLNSMGEGLYTLDAEGYLTYLNPAAEKLLGWTGPEIIGKRMHEMIHYKHPDESPFPIEECPILNILATRRTMVDFEDYFIRKDGAFFPVRYTMDPLIEQDQIKGIVVVFTEITREKQALQQLQNQSRLTKMITDNTTLPVFFCWIKTGALHS